MNNIKMKKIIFSTLFLVCLASNSLQIKAEVFGQCIHDPNADALQEKWKNYQNIMLKKAKINSRFIVDKALMDLETLKLLKAVSEMEELIIHFDELEKKYLRKAFVDTRFNEMIAHPDFLLRLETKQMEAEIKQSDLKFKNDPDFFILLEKIRTEVIKPEVKEALALFRNYDLGILESEYRKSAKMALKLIRSRGGTKTAVKSWFQDPPFLRNIPFPHEKLGPFALVYRSLVRESVAKFVTDRKVSLNEAKILFPNIKSSEVEMMNNILPPVENLSFDEHIGTQKFSDQVVFNGKKLSSSQILAIDGVVRTLWGEAASCESLGLPQFEAIGRIIADRSIAVCKTLSFQGEVTQKSVEVREKNWTTFLKNWAGISRPAPGLENRPSNPYKGLSDFGRKENTKLDCAAQVVSKKNQFSVWNSYSLKKYQTGQFHKNIPNATYEIQGPQAPNDDKALTRILCPQFISKEQKELWNKALEISKWIVVDPKGLKQKIVWPKFDELYFYTHEANLPFAKEVKIPQMIIDGKPVPLRGKGRNPCNKFKLFVPKQKMNY